MNAFGDATFVLALFILVEQTGSLDFSVVFAAAPEALGDELDARRPRRARAPRRRRRQVGAGAAPHLAPGRDGGPDPGQRAHPRGHHGHRRRLPDRPHEPALRAGDRRAGAGRDPRRGDAAHGRPDRARPDRHQARHRLLDHEPDRLHVRRRRARRLRREHVPPDDARLLQGAALHGRRARHPRPLRRAGHPQDGRPRARAAVDLPRLPHRRACPRGDPAVRGLLLQGRHPLEPGRPGLARLAPLGCRNRRRVPDRGLHLPAPVHRLLRGADAVRARAPAQGALRGPALDDVAGRRPRSALHHRRVPAGARAVASGHRVARPCRRVRARGDRRARGFLHPRLARGGRRAASPSRGRSTAVRATGPPRSAPGCPGRRTRSSTSSGGTRPTTRSSTGRPRGSRPGSWAGSRGLSSSARSAASAPASATSPTASPPSRRAACAATSSPWPSASPSWPSSSCWSHDHDRPHPAPDRRGARHLGLPVADRSGPRAASRSWSPSASSPSGSGPRSTSTSARRACRPRPTSRGSPTWTWPTRSASTTTRSG